MPPDFLKPRQSTHRYPTDFLLGDLLVKAGIVSQKQLDDSVQSAGGKHLNVGQMLIVARYITARDLQAAVDAQSALRDRVVDMNTAIKGLKAACRAGIPFAEAVRTQDPTATKSIPTNKLGELLLEANIIDGDQFGKALQRSLSTGLPLGRILVLNNAISETLLTTALEIQVRVRDDMLSREEAIDYLKITANQNSEEGISPEGALKIQALLKAPRKSGIRLGELLVLARVLGETDVMNALELGLVNDQPIGQILVAQGFVSPELLDSALRLQELVDAGHLDGGEAAERLSKIHVEGVPFTEVVGDIELEEEPRPVVNFQTMLTLGRVITEDDFQAAFDLALTSPQVVATVLLMTGYMDEPTTDATLKCHNMILDGYLSQEDALVALDYCLQKMAERPISYEEALQELGWSLPPELLSGVGLASLRSQPEPVMNFAVDGGAEPVNGTGPNEDEHAHDETLAESMYDTRNGDEAAVEDHIGGYDTANGAEATAETPQEEHHFETPEPMAEVAGDWSLPVSEPVETGSRSDFSVSEVSEQASPAPPTAEPRPEQTVPQAPVASPPEAKRSISLNQMKESARQLSQNRVSQSNVVDTHARHETQEAAEAARQPESEQSVPATTPQVEEVQTSAPVTTSGSFKRKSSLKSLLAPSANSEQPAAPPKPSIPPRDFAEATIDPDAAIAALPAGSLKMAKAPELELSEEEQAIIARASSLSATIEDMEAAARIVGKKQEVLRGVPGAVSDHEHEAGRLDAQIAEMKKKIPETEFGQSIRVEEPDPSAEVEEIELNEEQLLDKSKPQNGGLGSFLARAKGDGKGNKPKPPASGLGAHLGGSKQRGVIGEALSKAKFEDSGLSAHLNKPKSSNRAGLGTLLGKPKGDRNGTQSSDSVPALVAPHSEGGESAVASTSADFPRPAMTAGTAETAEVGPASLEEISDAIAPGLKEDKPFALNDSLIRLAESYYEQGKYTDAENLYNRILKLREAEAGPFDPNFVGDLNNLAGVLCVQGKFKEAEPYVERAVELIEKLEPGDSLKLADSLNTLAGIYYQQDKYEQCETLLSRALIIRQKLLGEDHQDVADNLRDYAKFLRKINRPEEAEKLYTQAKEIVARAHKRKHSQSDSSG